MKGLSNRNRAEVDEGDAVNRLLSEARPEPQDLASEKAQLLFDRALVASLRTQRRQPAYNQPVLWASACGFLLLTIVAGRALWSLRQPSTFTTRVVRAVLTSTNREPSDLLARGLKRKVWRQPLLAKAKPEAARPTSVTRSMKRFAAQDDSLRTVLPKLPEPGPRMRTPMRVMESLERRPSLLIVHSARPDFKLFVREAPPTSLGFARVSTTAIDRKNSSRTTCTVEHTSPNSSRMTIASADAMSAPTFLMVETESTNIGGSAPAEGAKP